MSYATVARRFACAALLLLGGPASLGCHQRQPAVNTHSPALDEVNVGYGTAKRQDVGGAISTWSGEGAARDRTGGIDELLRSSLPGVQVFRSARGEISLSIRGRSNPLILLDGAPIRPADLDHINPYDIERIDVMRDLASSAIYGVRGENGVVMITTRRPR